MSAFLLDSNLYKKGVPIIRLKSDIFNQNCENKLQSLADIALQILNRSVKFDSV